MKHFSSSSSSGSWPLCGRPRSWRSARGPVAYEGARSLGRGARRAPARHRSGAQIVVKALARKHPNDCVLHEALSLNALPRIERPDVVLIDGDHNWYTVHRRAPADRGPERGFP